MPLPYPINLTGPILLAWYSIGLIYLVWLTRRFPERLLLTAHIFGDPLPVAKPNANLMPSQ